MALGAREARSVFGADSISVGLKSAWRLYETLIKIGHVTVNREGKADAVANVLDKPVDHVVHRDRGRDFNAPAPDVRKVLVRGAF